MRRLTLLFIVLVTTIILPNRPAAAQSDEAAWILSQINDLRQKNGLAPLALNAQLVASASAHSTYMATHPFVDPHREDNGSTPASRAWAAGYPGKLVGENVVGGSMATVTWAFQWWMNSPVHYRNMLAGWTEVGVGVASGPYGKFYTTDFGTQGQGLEQPTSAQAVNPGNAQPASSGNNPVKAPPPTRRATPIPTATPTITLTPSLTFTPRATFTPTFTATGRPPTETPIVLEISPRTAQPTATEPPAPADTQVAAVMAVAMVASPIPSAPKSSVSTPNDGLRSLIPWILLLQVGIGAGFVVSRIIRRR